MPQLWGTIQLHKSRLCLLSRPRLAQVRVQNKRQGDTMTALPLPDNDPKACPDCKGTGRIHVYRQFGVRFLDMGFKRCDTCRGTGRKVDPLYLATMGAPQK